MHTHSCCAEHCTRVCVASVCRKKDDEVGRLIDQATSEISSSVESVRMKQGQLKQKEHQIQQLRNQVLDGISCTVDAKWVHRMCNVQLIGNSGRSWHRYRSRTIWMCNVTLHMLYSHNSSCAEGNGSLMSLEAAYCDYTLRKQRAAQAWHSCSQQMCLTQPQQFGCQKDSTCCRRQQR